MRLLLDMGNSAVKWGLEDPQRGLHGTGVSYHGDGALEAVLTAVCRDLPAPAEVVVSNVAGDGAAGRLQAVVDRRWGVPVRFVTAAADHGGLRNAYHRPETLGSDRWAAMVAAHALWPGTVLVADCGSAITADVVTADGVHRGGLIMPGLAMMRRALAAGTRAIGEAGTGEPGALAANTRDAVVSGTFLMVQASLDRVLDDTRREFGAPLSAIITGGDAPGVLARLAGEWHHDPHLVLRGLAMMTED